MSTIEYRATQLIAEHLGVPEDKVTPDADIRDDLGGDSLDVVELVMACEEEFDCEITDQQQEKITTVQDVFDVLQASGAK